MIIQLMQVSLFALCIWAVLMGGRPEQWGAILLFVDLTVRTILTAVGFPLDFYTPRPIYLLATGLLFLASLALAVRSNRMWPLFFSAFCLVQLAGHFSVLVLDAGNSRAYWTMTQVPLVIQTLVLGLGTLAMLARSRKGVSADDWC